MINELETIDNFKCWELIERPTQQYLDKNNMKILNSLFIFTVKNNILRKSRLCIRGDQEPTNPDYNNFSTVVNKTSLKLMLAVAAKYDLDIIQYDVKSAFLNAPLPPEREVFINIPYGFSTINKNNLNLNNKVLKLKRYIYGLADSMKGWSIEHSKILKEIGFKQNELDEQLFFRDEKKKGTEKENNKKFKTDQEIKENNFPLTVILIHVDDGLLLGKKETLIKISEFLKSKFEIKLTEEVTDFISFKIKRDRKNKLIYLDFSNKIIDLSERLLNSEEKNLNYQTPMESNVQQELIQEFQQLDRNKTPINIELLKQYQSLLGSLTYFCIIRVDIMFSVNFLSQFSKNPSKIHYRHLKRILIYLYCTNDFKLKLGNIGKVDLEGYCDASFSNENNRRSRAGGFLMYYGGVIAHFSKVIKTPCQSTMESEYCSMLELTKLIIYVQNLLTSLKINFQQPTLAYADNKSAMFLAENSRYHDRTKHFDIKYHAIRFYIKDNRIRFTYVRTTDMIGDILTKPLGRILFFKFRAMMNLGKLIIEGECDDESKR